MFAWLKELDGFYPVSTVGGRDKEEICASTKCNISTAYFTEHQ